MPACRESTPNTTPYAKTLNASGNVRRAPSRAPLAVKLVPAYGSHAAAP